MVKMNHENILEVGKILMNTETFKFCQIKEITRLNNKEKNVHSIVCSGYCNYFNDAKTTCLRMIMTNDCIQNHVIVDNEISIRMWKIYE